MNKRAIETETLVILLIFIAGAFILLVFSSQLSNILKGKTDIETCRLSVLAQAKARTLPIVGVDTPRTAISLDCSRRIIKIFEDKVEVNGKKSTEYDFNKLTAEEVNHIVAEELRTCWYMMVEGNRNVFEQSIFFSEGNYYTCLICAEIEFDKNIKPTTFEGLNDYLKSRKIPEQDLSYFDYLVRSQREIFAYLPYGQYYNPFGYGTTNKIAEEKINANEKYLIYFLAMKPAWLVEKTRAYTSAYYIGLGKENKLTEECDTLVN